MKQEYQKALQDFNIALMQFDQADPEHIDIAIHRLQAAELQVGNAIKELKGEEKSA